MIIDLDLKFKKIIELASIKGSIDLDLRGEFITKHIIKPKILSELKNLGLTGTVTIDGKTYKIPDIEETDETDGEEKEA